MQFISSRQNEIIKYARFMQTQKGRKYWGLALIEGATLIGEALAYGAPMHSVYALKPKAEELEKDLHKLGIRLYGVTDEVMQALSTFQDTPDCVALCHIPKTELPHKWKKDDVLLVLERVQDPGNVGALMRSADALGACGVLLLDGCADAWNTKVMRAAMGAHFHIPVYTQGDTVAAFFELKRAGMYVLSTSLQGSEKLLKPDHGPMALLLGNEGTGVSGEALELSDYIYRLPMRGRAQSLNVAAAGAILLYLICGPDAR